MSPMDTLELRALAQQPLPAIQATLGQWLTQGRVMRGWRQADLAEKTGVNLRTIKRIEAGENVAMDAWWRVVQALGHGPDLLAILSTPCPASLDAFEAVARGEHRGRQRVRP